MAQTAANFQKLHANALEKQDNSFTRKLKENKEAFRRAQQSKGGNAFIIGGGNNNIIRGISNQPGILNNNNNNASILAMGVKEFSTPGCSDINDYQLGK